MPIPLTAPQVLDREFLELRAKLLELAAGLDRIDRAAGDVEADPRLGKIEQALEVLGSDEPGRAEQVQMIFSLPFDQRWRDAFELRPRG
ncbi:MAG TPA: hypothetical protein VF278_08190 [Pirellulales bacterium]